MQVPECQMLKKMRAGDFVISVKTNRADPRIIEIATLCGYEAVWLDLEHIYNDWHTIENQIRAAKMHGMDPIVRVTRGSYSDLIRPLEANAAGIIVPHIMSLADARQVVNQTRFHPIGRRPVDGGNADGAYCMIDFIDYIKSSNEQKALIVQIEDPEPLADLEAIAELDGIDMLFFGPGDFSHGIGAPAQFDHPLVIETRKRIARVAREHGKLAGTVGTVANLPELLDMGYQFINIGADVLGLVDYFRGLTTEIQAIRDKR